MLNPGQSHFSADYFSIASQIVTFEHDYGSYSISKLASSALKQQSVLIYSFTKGDAAALETVVKALKTKGVGSLYVTDLQLAETDVWKGFGTLLDELVKDTDGSA